MTEEPAQPPEGKTPWLASLFWRTPARRFLTVFALLYFLVGVLTLDDYGMTWDESWENYYGDKTLNYYFSFDRSHLDFEKATIPLYDHPLHPDFHFAATLYRDNDLLTKPHVVWPVAPVLSSACKYAFFRLLPIMTVVDAHHMAPLLGGLLLALGLFVFLRHRVGLLPAALATVCLAAYPRWWAHCHFNPKDVVSTVFIGFTVFSFVKAVETRRVRHYVISGILCGLSVACKANALFLPFIVLPYFIAALASRRRHDESIVTGREIACWVAYPAVALLTAFACWPLMWVDFPDNVVKYWHSLVDRGYTGTTGWNVLPVKYAFATMPIMMILLLTVGAVITLRGKTRWAPLNLLFFAWMLVPIGRVCLPGAKDFDGIRHWLEALPPAAAMMGIGGAWALTRIQTLADSRHLARSTSNALLTVVAFVLFLPQLAWMTYNHPHQLTFFNPLVGRLSGARERGYPEATDYWGYSYRRGIEWINANAAPDPFVTLEVAEHLAFYYFDCIVNEDVTVRPVALMEETLRREPHRPYYLMTIVREDWYRNVTKKYHERPIVHRIAVNGADILLIRRIDAGGSPVFD